MGFLFDNFSIAMEADDITARVAETMNGKGNRNNPNQGGNDATPAPDTAAAGNARDEDLTNTNILAQAAQDEPPPEQADAGGPDTGENDMGEGADDAAAPAGNADAGGGDPLADPGDNGGDEAGGTDDTEMDEEGGEGSDELNPNDSLGDGPTNNPPSVFSDKNTLKSNAIHFMSLMDGDLAILNARLGDLNEIEDLRVMNKVIQNLTLTKKLLNKTITEDFSNQTYESLMTKYITMKQIYDLSIEMLDKHFNKDPKRRKSSKKATNRDLG